MPHLVARDRLARLPEGGAGHERVRRGDHVMLSVQAELVKEGRAVFMEPLEPRRDRDEGVVLGREQVEVRFDRLDLQQVRAESEALGALLGLERVVARVVEGLEGVFAPDARHEERDLGTDSRLRCESGKKVHEDLVGRERVVGLQGAVLFLRGHSHVPE